MITCHRPELERALKLATQIAGNAKAMPVVANVVLRASGAGRLEILATDLRVSLRASIGCSMIDTLDIMIDARKLHEIVSKASADDIAISIDDKAYATLKSGKVTFKIAGQPSTSFPVIANATGPIATVETAILKEMINRTWFAASDDDTRPHLNGIYLSSDGTRTTMTSTDGYRMCRLSRPLGMSIGAVIVPCIETLRAVLGQTPTCQLQLDKQHLFVSLDTATIAIKLIDLAYPNVSGIFDMDSRTKIVTCNREAILIAMRRASTMTTEFTPVRMTFGRHTLALSVINPDLGEVREDLDVVYDGPPVTIGFNPVFVVDLLTQMSSDQVILEMSDPLQPALVRQAGSDDYAGIVLPMRVS